MKTNFLIIALSFFFYQFSFCQDREKYYELIEVAEKNYNSKNYKESGLKYAEAFVSLGNRGMITDRYNAACSWALAGEEDSSFIQLLKISSKGYYKDYDHIKQDSDLKTLYKDKRWERVLAFVKANKSLAEKSLDRALITILDSIHEEDQAGRVALDEIEEKYGRDSEEVKAAWDEISFKDSMNLIVITKILDERGWLGLKVIGSKGNSTLFLVIQHSNQETQEKYLPMLREAVKNRTARGSDLALLEDRVGLGKGEKQVYGSQIGTNPKTGKHFVLPLTDPDNVDKRRAEVGLQPIAEYCKYFDFEWDIEKHKKINEIK